VSYAMSNQNCLITMIIYTFIAHIAITCHMTLVKEFGGVAAVLVGNFRKALTIYLSFLLFPKPHSILYVLGAILVFGGLFAQEYTRELRKQKNHVAAKIGVDSLFLAKKENSP
jgi:adenosine 3'-phospho 5'-phosphosulfate transporter B3